MKASLSKLFILIFCIFLFSFGARNPSLEFKGDENFYFESVKGMLRTGDLLTPRYMGEERFQKPILFYWLILSSFKLFGINWLAARIPSIISGTLLAYLVFAISNLLFEDRQISLFAALFLATTPLCYRYARLALPDMSLVFFITLALYNFLRLNKDRADYKSFILFFLALAFAFLLKGPVGLIIPLLIVAIFCLIKKEKPFGLGNISMGIVIFALIVGPWFYLIYRIHGETYVGHIWAREILQRLGYGYNESFLIRYFKGLFFYTSALMTKFLPYSLFLPIAFINSLRASSNQFLNKHKENKSDAHLFLILWILGAFLFFTFVAERRTHYLLALSPAVSISVGAIFKKAISDKQLFKRASFRIPYLATVIGIIFFAVTFIISDFLNSGDKIAFWKLVLMVIPIILVIGLRRRYTSFMPLSLVLSLSAVYSAMAVSQPFGLFTNKMERAAMAIKSELKEGDRIGIGSHGIIPEELQVFFAIPAENVKATYRQNGAPNLDSASRLLQFLNSDGRIFCVIKKEDYDIFIPEKLRNNLYILERYYVWKRRIRFNEKLKESLANIKSFGSLREIFQNEIYVVSNRRPSNL